MTCLAGKEAVGGQAGHIELDTGALAVLQRSLQQQAVGIQAALRIADHPPHKHCRLLHYTNPQKSILDQGRKLTIMSMCIMWGNLVVGLGVTCWRSQHTDSSTEELAAAVRLLLPLTAVTGEEPDTVLCIAPKKQRDKYFERQYPMLGGATKTDISTAAWAVKLRATVPCKAKRPTSGLLAFTDILPKPHTDESRLRWEPTDNVLCELCNDWSRSEDFKALPMQYPSPKALPVHVCARTTQEL